MPLYEYACRECGTRVEKMRKVSERLSGPPCPACGMATALAVSAPGRVGASVSSTGAGYEAGGSCGPGGCCGGACTPSFN